MEKVKGSKEYRAAASEKNKKNEARRENTKQGAAFEKEKKQELPPLIGLPPKKIIAPRGYVSPDGDNTVLVPVRTQWGKTIMVQRYFKRRAYAKMPSGATPGNEPGDPGDPGPSYNSQTVNNMATAMSTLKLHKPGNGDVAIIDDSKGKFSIPGLLVVPRAAYVSTITTDAKGTRVVMKK